MAEWLNRAFYSFDFALLEFGHNMHIAAGGFFDGFWKFVTVFGDGGIILILISLVLIAFKKTRKIGLTMFGAIAIGALITNITIKPLVARPRPYADETKIFYTWWKAAGSVQESEFSFPSGHSTASMAAMMAFFLAGNKKYSWTGFFAALLIGFSRIYLCVHYPSDVLFGFIVGIIAGAISYLIVWFIYKYLKGKKLGDILYEKDIITLYHFIKNKYFNKNKTATVQGELDSNQNLQDTMENVAGKDDSLITSVESGNVLSDNENIQNNDNKNIENIVLDTKNITDKEN